MHNIPYLLYNDILVQPGTVTSVPLDISPRGVSVQLKEPNVGVELKTQHLVMDTWLDIPGSFIIFESSENKKADIAWFTTPITNKIRVCFKLSRKSRISIKFY